MSNYKTQDHFFKKAKRDRFVARSVYKLAEIDRRYQLLGKGARIVDLGAAPGSWLQYIAKAIGKKGMAIGYDLVELQLNPGPNTRSMIADVLELEADRIRLDFARAIAERKNAEPPNGPIPKNYRIDAVVSDMAPKLTGVRDADQAKSVELGMNALRIANEVVKPEGFFIAKLFQGRETDAFVAEAKKSFKNVKLLKPEATRDGSREVFLVALARRTA